MLKFEKNKKFKIMQITDIQEVPNISKDTMKLLNAAIKTQKPDLVVLTGDQIKGYGVTYKGKGEQLENAVKSTIEKFMKPILDEGIPFAVTFGNHDRQVGVTNKEQFEKIYASLDGFTAENVNFIDERVDFNVSIKSSDGEKTALNLFLIDSGTDVKAGYEPVLDEQIQWYKELREKLKAENSNEYVPSLVFQHIPIDEYFEVLKKVSRFEKGAIRAFRTHKNTFYKLGDSCHEGDILLEPPSIPDLNTGEFDAFKEKGDVLGMYVGHDHKNSFTANHDGIELGFTPSAGFNEYGNGIHRGVRVFEFDENDIKNYTSKVITFETLCGNKLDKPVKDFIFRHFPACKDAAILLGRNAALIIAAAYCGIWALTKLF